MKWSIRVGRVFGTDVKVHISLILVIPLVLFHYRADSRNVVLFTLASIGVVFACIFLHELGHMLMARFFGIQVYSIVLWPLGGFATLSQTPEKPWHTLLIAAAGPLVNLLLMGILGLAAVGAFLAGTLSAVVGRWDSALAQRFPEILLLWAIVNLALALLNLLPIFPLDGGQIVRAALQMAVGERYADSITMGISLPLAVGLGVFSFARGDWLMVLLAGLFVLASTSLSRRVRSSFHLGLLYLVERGGFYQQQGDYLEAVTWYTRSLQQRPPPARASRYYNNRGAAWLYMSDYSSARSDFEQAIALKPGLAAAYSNRGLIAYLAGRFDHALADFDQAIQLGAGLAYPYANRGRLYRAWGILDQALTDFEEAIRLDPTTPIFYLDRAVLRYYSGDRVGAQADGELALSLSSNKALIHEEFMLHLIFRGHLEWALDYYGYAGQLFPHSPLLHRGRADAYRINGDQERAIAEYDQALRLAPGSGRAEIYLGRSRAYQEQGDPQRAAADLYQVLSLSKRPHLRRQARVLLQMTT